MAASFRRPVAVSAGVHLVVLLFLVWLAGRAAPPTALLPGGPGPVGGGRGMRQITYLTFPAFQATAADQTRGLMRLPPPTPRVQVVDLPTSASVADVVPMASLGSGLEVPSGAGPGGGGAGGGERGVGRGSEPGTGGSGAEVFPPQARYSILPPLPRPSSVRGKTLRVHFWVDAGGRVTRVDVSPSISDGEYRKQFLQLMYQYTFAPALRPDGTPVAGETVMVFTL
jgi:hypothetical protein